MRIGVMGAGYVGLVAGTCFAEMGNHVHIVDISPDVVDTLRSGRIHYYEPGLEELVVRNLAAGRLRFGTETGEMVRRSEVIFLAVGTPQGEDGSADLSFIRDAACAVAGEMDGYRLIVVKSTVPVGTNAELAERIADHTAHPFDIASNPEFLKEGAALDDFMRPDRVVIGVRSPRAETTLRHLYDPFLRTGHALMVMDPESAEMTKYVSNALLASRISFMNEMANICQRVGGDIDLVRKAVGADRRIGGAFLFPGLGYGGSCFPKDVRALARIAEKVGLQAHVCEAVDRVNVAQQLSLLPPVEEAYGRDLSGRTFALWGLAFKPRTDDVREAPAILLANALLDRGAAIRAYDPEARERAAAAAGMERAEFCKDAYAALENADGLLICTEWNEFRSPDFERMKALMNFPRIFDGRNLYPPEACTAAGFSYWSIGRPPAEGRPA